MRKSYWVIGRFICTPEMARAHFMTREQVELIRPLCVSMTLRDFYRIVRIIRNEKKQ